MVGTRQLAELVAHAAQHRTKLVLVDDPRQLPEIEADASFRALTMRGDPIVLSDNRRQHQQWERDALERLRSGRAREARPTGTRGRARPARKRSPSPSARSWYGCAERTWSCVPIGKFCEGGGVFRTRDDAVSRFRFVEDHRDVYDVKRLCLLVEVSRSGYYAWRQRPPSARAVADGALIGEIRRIHETSRRTYGRVRIAGRLRREGRLVNHKRVGRLMRREGIVGKTRKARSARCGVGRSRAATRRASSRAPSQASGVRAAG